MRVLQLGVGGGRSIDLHPAASIVVGLSDGERTALRRGFTAVATGSSPAQHVLVEAHGVLLDATQEDLDLLEVACAPVLPVATVVEVPGALPGPDAEAMSRAERALLTLAADRWRDPVPATAPIAHPHAADPSRADELRGRIARHEARQPEGVRVALDDVRDAERTGGRPDPGALAGELAAVGLDTTDLGLPVGELVRIAEDWLDERRREADWVVGATVELAAIEAGAPGPGVPDERDVEGGGVRSGSRRSAADEARALLALDELRSRLAAVHAPAPSAAELEAHLVTRLGAHRPARLAGAVPLVLDGVLGHLADDDVARLLDRVAALAGPVQLVVVDDHPAARTWVAEVGIRRAAVVQPSPGRAESLS